MGIESNDLLVSTDAERHGQVESMIERHVGFYDHLKKKGRFRKHTGGRVIQIDMTVRENEGFKFQSQEEKMSTLHTQPTSFAETDVKIATVPVTVFDLEEQLNKGSEAAFQILGTRQENAEETMINQIAVIGAYGTGTGFGGKAITGIQHYLSDAPTSGIVETINRATAGNEFWRNKVYSATTQLGAPKSVSNYKRGLDAVYRTTILGKGGADFFVADNEDFGLYEASLTSITRITSKDDADSGYETLSYKGKPFIFDGGLDGGAPANTTFGIRLADFEWVYVEGRNMSMIAPRTPTDQLAKIYYKVFYGQLVMKRARQSFRYIA